jgi:putative DNA-invertase from lambdoid prophage Rac
VRRGQGYSLHVTAPLDVHHAVLRAGDSLNAEGAPSADRKAYRIYCQRVETATTIQLAARAR